MPDTWKDQSIQVLGYVAPMTKTNTEYVTLMTVNNLVTIENKTPAKVFLRWNGGYATECSEGYNWKNVYYNSCKYINKAINYYNKLK